MLSAFLSKFRIRSNVERRAARIWNNGNLVVDSRAPILGEAWPKEYYPYWREWSKDVHGWMYKHADWTSIEDVPFWNAMAPKMNGDDFFEALERACLRGNLSILEAFSQFAPERMPEFAQRYRSSLQAGRGAPATVGLVHPDAALWLRERQFWSEQDTLALASAYQFRHENVSNIRQIDPRGLCSDAYVLDWSIKSLRDLGWGREDQVRFLGNLLTTKCAGVLLDNIADFRAVVHSGIDFALLANVAGIALDHVEQRSATVASIHVSVQQTSTYIREHDIDVPAWIRQWATPSFSIKNGHAGLNAVIGLHDIDTMTLAQLYHLAYQVQQRELGHIAMESLALPELSV